MTCREPFKGYPSYACYKDIKYNFVDKIKENRLEISSYIQEFEPKYPEGKLQEPKKLSEIFTNFKKHLSNHHVFASGNYNEEGTCNYISYLLYDGILKKKNGECDKQTFNDFKNFADSYNASGALTRCINKINYLDFDDYRKRESLYKLYDMYNDLESKKGMKNPPNICSIVKSLIYYYNDFNKEFYEKDEELLKKLQNLKPLIEEHTWVSKHNCDARLSSLQTLKSEFLERQKQPKIQDAESTLTLLSNQASTVRLEREDKLITMPSERESQRLDVREEQLELRGHESQITELGVRGVPQTRTGGAQTAVEPNGILAEATTFAEGTNYQLNDHRDSLKYTKPFDEHETYFEQQYRNPTVYPQINPNDEGVFVSMKNTLSSIVQNVEPAPILGVSGGMGALFLLFKYTPVGTFFRGRRGRTYGIPSGFNGPFTGEFAGYQDYLGGNIGYSQMSHLAE
ncbi:hypothetical protein PVC01_000122900 [Plasmodium vivax]|uniref:VIR protein n=1 Tax=Plasmodium vivax TaxID=5855 RepID=A0A1G4EDK0_PLAVI|nr:hypothetical protein PVC01_000122900 [Plasmodium vivax]